MLEWITSSFDFSFRIIFHNFRENCRDLEYSQWGQKNASGNSGIFQHTFHKYRGKLVAYF